MPVSVKVVLDKTKQVAVGLALASSQRVMAGVPAEKGLRPEDEDGKPSGINNAALMYIHEFGAPEANIPARPVVYPAIKSIRSDVIKELEAITIDALSGRAASIMPGFHRIGIMAQNAMQARITDGPFVPLQPSTLAARRARGHDSDRPLIEFGYLRKALIYVIRKII